LKIGSNIKSIRRKKGISREELAELVGVSIHSIAKYEQDTREPDLDTIQRIAESLEVSSFELMQLSPLEIYNAKIALKKSEKNNIEDRLGKLHMMLERGVSENRIEDIRFSISSGETKIQEIEREIEDLYKEIALNKDVRATQEDIDKMFGPELNQNKVDRSNDLLEAAFTMSKYFFPGNEPKQQIEIPFSREDANGMIIDGFKKVLLSKRLQDIDFLKYKIRYYTRLLEELEKVSDSDPASE